VQLRLRRRRDENISTPSGAGRFRFRFMFNGTVFTRERPDSRLADPLAHRHRVSDARHDWRDSRSPLLPKHWMDPSDRSEHRRAQTASVLITAYRVGGDHLGVLRRRPARPTRILIAAPRSRWRRETGCRRDVCEDSRGRRRRVVRRDTCSIPIAATSSKNQSRWPFGVLGLELPGDVSAKRPRCTASASSVQIGDAAL